MTAQLDQMVLSRIHRLATPALSVARAASVLQQDLTPEQVAVMLDLPLLETAAAWDDLEQAEILMGDRFGHDLLADVVYRSIPGVARGLLHRAAARLLVAAGGPAARVARHWLEGSRPLDAAQWYSEAAQAARSTYRPREAEAFYDQAARLYNDLDQLDAAFEARCGQVAMLNEIEDARPRQQTLVQDLLSSARTSVQQAQARFHAATLMFVQNDVTGMERAARDGLALLQGTDQLALQAELYETLAGAMLIARRPADAAEALKQLLQISEQLGNVSRQAIAYDGLGQVTGYTSPREALTMFEHAEALCLQIRDQPQAAAVITKQARMQQKMGQFTQALATLERATHGLAADSYRVRQLINTYFKTLCWQAQGEYQLALEHIAAAQVDHAASESVWLDALEMQRVRLLLDLGQVQAAHQAAWSVMASPRLGSSLHLDRASMWAAVLAAEGNLADARTVIEETQQLLDVYPDVYLRPRLAVEWAALHPPAQAVPALQSALQDSVVGGLRGVELAVQVRLAQAHLALGERAQLPADGEPDAVVSRGELLLTRALVLEQWNSESAASAHIAARQWFEERAAQLVPAYRHTFLNRPSARQVMALAVVDSTVPIQ